MLYFLFWGGGRLSVAFITVTYQSKNPWTEPLSIVLWKFPMPSWQRGAECTGPRLALWFAALAPPGWGVLTAPCLCQAIVGAEGLSLAFRHIASSLLGHCSHASCESLLHEVIVCVGYFTVNHPDNQVRGPGTFLRLLPQPWECEVLQWEKAGEPAGTYLFCVRPLRQAPGICLWFLLSRKTWSALDQHEDLLLELEK